MKHLTSIFVFTFALTTACATQATMVEYVEDAYAVQAPQEIADVVQEAARTVNFDKSYEVVVPKKAGLHINPWNQFVSSGTNPATHNWFILVNPTWFSTLPHDQQMFLLCRSFVQANMGVIPPIAQYIPWLFVILTWVLVYVLYRLFGRTRLNQHNPAVRVMIAFGILFVLNVALVNKLQVKLLDYMYRKHDNVVNMVVIEKTGNREAAIKALQTMDAEVKKGIANGETAFVPFEHVFETIAKGLTT